MKNRTQKVAQELSTCFTYAVPFPVDVIDEAVITVAIWVYKAGREDRGKCTAGQWDPLLGKVRMKRGKGWAWGAWLLFCVDSQRGRHGIFEALRKKITQELKYHFPGECSAQNGQAQSSAGYMGSISFDKCFRLCYPRLSIHRSLLSSWKPDLCSLPGKPLPSPLMEKKCLFAFLST